MRAGTCNAVVDHVFTQETQGEFSNRRNCRVHIRGEKEVCLFWSDLCAVVRPLFALEWKDLKKAINKRFKKVGDPHTNDYVTKVVGPLVKKKGGGGGGR